MDSLHHFLILVRAPRTPGPNQITFIVPLPNFTSKLAYRLVRTSGLTLHLTPTALLCPIVDPNIPPPGCTNLRNGETVTCIVLGSTVDASVVIATETKSGMGTDGDPGRSHPFRPRIHLRTRFRRSAHCRPRLRHSYTWAHPARRQRMWT